MKLRTLAPVVVMLGLAVVCVRLGFWQLARLRYKQDLNVALNVALAVPPVALTDPDTPADSVLGRRVILLGRYDAGHQLMLAGLSYDGEPGVGVVTPLVFEGGTHAVLVDRGWLQAADAVTAHPERFPEPGLRTVIGIADTFTVGQGPPGPRAIASDSSLLYSVPWLDRDSIATRLPYTLARFWVHQQPGAGVPLRPRRMPPPVHEAGMHLSYAIQWFLFALALVAGSAFLVWTRRPGPPIMTRRAR